MSASSSQNPSDIIKSYLAGSTSFDAAVKQYGDANHLEETNVNKRVNAFANEVINSGDLKKSNFSKLAEIEHKIYQSSPESAYKVYETAIKILFGDKPANLKNVEESAHNMGLTGRSSRWDKFCFKVKEAFNEYFSSQTVSLLELFINKANAMFNREIRKEKQEIDPMINKQHLVLQYLSLLPEEERSDPEAMNACLQYADNPLATQFLDELEKFPGGIELLQNSDPKKLSSYLNSTELLKGTEGDENIAASKKQAILLAARLLPENSDTASIQAAAEHLILFSEEIKNGLLSVSKADPTDEISLGEILNLHPNQEEEVDVGNQNKQENIEQSSASSGGSWGNTLRGSIGYIGSSLQTGWGQVGSALSSFASYILPIGGSNQQIEQQRLSEEPKTNVRDLSIGGSSTAAEFKTSSPTSQSQLESVQVAPISLAQTQQTPKQEALKFFNGIDLELGKLIEGLPEFPIGTTVQVAGDKLTITLPNVMTAKVNPNATVGKEDYERLNRHDVRFYEPIRKKEGDLGNGGTRLEANTDGGYPVSKLSFFGSIGGMVTRQLVGGKELAIGPTITLTKGMNGTNPTLNITGVPQLSSVELCNSAGDKYDKNEVGNGKLYMKIPPIIWGLSAERWFIKDIQTLMTVLTPV